MNKIEWEDINDILIALKIGYESTEVKLELITPEEKNLLNKYVILTDKLYMINEGIIALDKIRAILNLPEDPVYQSPSPEGKTCEVTCESK
ncbi:MAG: hypothetical protein LBG80_04640 [Bacteroidales bacterium]|jgi:hypothetical protein|nr:hypothetical protein [Bacteroidales bacterium]